MHIRGLKMSTEEEQGHCGETMSKGKLIDSSELGRDSGFLSGACGTESDLITSTCDLGLGASCSSSISTSAVFHRLDSGVDVSEHLSQLNLSSDILNKTSRKEESRRPVDPSEYPPLETLFAQDDEGDTQLHIAVIEGLTEAVCTLISLVPHPSVLDIQNDLSQTALHLAVITKQPRIARRLVAAGARVDLRDHSGNTALHLAAESGDVGSVQALTMALSVAETQACQLRYPPFAQSPPQLDLFNYEGQASIHLAAIGGHCDVIRALHWLGADLNIMDGKSGRTALHYAVKHGHFTAISCLTIDCRVELELSTYAGFTPYQLAADSKTPQVATELARIGAIPLLPQPEEDDEMDEFDSEPELH